MRAVDDQPAGWDSDVPADEAPDRWDRFLRTRTFEAWAATEDARLQSDGELRQDRVDTLDRFVRVGSKRLLGGDPSPAWAIIVGAMVIAAWDAARRLSGAPEMCVGGVRAGASFGSVAGALRFAVYNEAVLGVGPLSLVVAEDRDEDRIARARAIRNGVEFIIARQTRSGSTGGTKSQGAVDLRSDVLRAIAASGVGLIDLALLLQADVGVWRPAGDQAAERAVVDYVRWRLEADLAAWSSGSDERLERAAGEASRRAEAAAQAVAVMAARLDAVRASETPDADLPEAERALAEARRRAAVAEASRELARADLAQASDLGRRSAAAQGVRARLARLPRTLPRVSGALLRELSRQWGEPRGKIERDAIEWRSANPTGPIELVRLKPAEIASRLALLADAQDTETITAQTVGKRIAASRRSILQELVRRGLVPPPPPRRARAPERPPVAGYVPCQAGWQR